MTEDKQLNDAINQLFESTGTATDPEVRGMIIDVLKLADSKLYTDSDRSLVNATLSELRKSFKLFNRYKDHRKVTIFGSARTHDDNPEFIMAETTARKLSERGYMIITGAGGGIMEAGNKGALANMSFGVNIELPFEQHPNPFIANDPKLTSFKYFFNRKLMFVKECDAIILYPGGFGTHDEAFEALTLIQTGRSAPRPLLLMAPPDSNYWKTWVRFIQEDLLQGGYISPEDLNLFTLCCDTDEAVAHIQQFYKTYHSIRYDEGLAYMRINHQIPDRALEQLSEAFRDLTGDVAIEQFPDADSSGDKDAFSHLPRLVFPFNRISFGRLTAMIHAVNLLEEDTHV